MDDAALAIRFRDSLAEFYGRIDTGNFAEYRANAEREAARQARGRRMVYRIAAGTACAAVFAVILSVTWNTSQPEQAAGGGVTTELVPATDTGSGARAGSLTAADWYAYLSATTLITPSDALTIPAGSRLLHQTVTITYYDPINMELLP